MAGSKYNDYKLNSALSRPSQNLKAYLLLGIVQIEVVTNNPSCFILGTHVKSLGKCNKEGVQTETVETKDGYLCEWKIQEDYVAHPGKYHHGLIATIVFVTGAWVATAENYEVDAKQTSGPLDYFYVNESINYNELKPI